MNFTSEDFHLHYLPSYSLHIQSDIFLDHLLVMNEDKQVLVFMSYDNMSPSADAMRLLSLPFKQVRISLPQESLVLLPNEAYDEGDKSLYAPYFFEPNQDTIFAKEISGMPITALYQYDVLLYNRWEKLFPDATFVPYFDVVLKQVQSHIPIQGEVLGVHVFSEHADIYLFINGELKLYNTFEVSTSDDLSYFLLNIFKNFGISGKIQKIVISGAERESEWVSRLNNYTDDLTWLPSKHNWSLENDELKKKIESLHILVDSTLCV